MKGAGASGRKDDESGMTGVAIICEGLATGRSGERLLAPLDLTIRAGEALVLTGANGAGKSTLLRTLAGLLPPHSGRVRIEGAVAPDGEPATRVAEVAHYLGHRNALKAAATLRDNLALWHRLLGGRGAETEAAVSSALDAVGLSSLAELLLGHLSAGQQRRAALARLLLVARPVWLLDEPTGALDEPSRARFAAMARAHLAGGGLLIAATHQPLGIEACTLDLSAARPVAA